MVKELTYKCFISYDETDFQATVAAFVDGKLDASTSLSCDFSEPGLTLSVSGKFHGVEKMISRRLPLEEIVEKGFQALVDSPEEYIKIIATPK